MAIIDELQNEVNKLQEQLAAQLSELKQYRIELDAVSKAATKRVLAGESISDLARRKPELDMLIEASIAAIELLDLRYRNAQAIFEAKQREQEAESAQERSW